MGSPSGLVALERDMDCQSPEARGVAGGRATARPSSRHGGARRRCAPPSRRRRSPTCKPSACAARRARRRVQRELRARPEPDAWIRTSTSRRCSTTGRRGVAGWHGAHERRRNDVVGAPSSFDFWSPPPAYLVVRVLGLGLLRGDLRDIAQPGSALRPWSARELRPPPIAGVEGAPIGVQGTRCAGRRRCPTEEHVL